MLNFHEFFNPEEIRTNLANASYSKAIINYVAVVLVIGLLVALVVTIIGLFSGNIIEAIIGGAFTALIALIVYPIIIIIGAAVMNAAFFIPAKLVGGKGSFKDQFYGMSITIIPTTILMTVLYMFLLISFVSLFILVGFVLLPIAYLLLLTFMVYLYYMIWVMFKEIHQLSNGKQMLVVMGGMLILGIIFGIIFALFFGAMFISGLSALSTMPKTGLFGLM